MEHHTTVANKTESRYFADPEALPPIDDTNKAQVIVETPKGSHNKYAFDPAQKICSLKKSAAGRHDFPL